MRSEELTSSLAVDAGWPGRAAAGVPPSKVCPVRLGWASTGSARKASAGCPLQPLVFKSQHPGAELMAGRAGGHQIQQIKIPS